MRVLMISRACLVGPYQRKLEEIARFPGVELKVVVPSSWREGGRTVRLERLFTDGYELVVEPIAFSGSFHLHFYPLLGRRLRGFAPDIVHIDEEPYNLATWQALRQGHRLGARVLWFSWQNLIRPYPFPFSWIERYNLRNAEYAIVGTEGAAKVWREKGYEGPLAVVPQFGVDTTLYAATALRRSPAGEFVIGYVGRLVHEKGVDLLLAALAQLAGAWRLVVAGDGPELGRLSQQSHRLGLADQVSFEGHVPARLLPALYQKLDALVVPSRSRPNWVEQFGRVLIEAMSSGVPVIGSTCGEIPHLVGDAGMIFPEGDVEQLRDRLARLMRSRELHAEMAHRGRERVLNRFTQAIVAAQTLDVYRKMMRLPPSRER